MFTPNEEKARMFPRRTLLLMVLALAAFGRLWCATHPAKPPIAADAGSVR